MDKMLLLWRLIMMGKWVIVIDNGAVTSSTIYNEETANNMLKSLQKQFTEHKVELIKYK